MTDTATTVDQADTFPAGLPQDYALRVLHDRLSAVEQVVEREFGDLPTAADTAAPVDHPDADPTASLSASDREAFQSWLDAGRPSPTGRGFYGDRPAPDDRITTGMAPPPFGPVSTGAGPESTDAAGPMTTDQPQDASPDPDDAAAKSPTTSATKRR